jgi:hypothetical protein
MELKVFIQQTLEHIISGVRGSHSHAQQHGASIGSSCYLADVEFDVAVTTTDNAERKGGAGIFIAGFGIGGSGKTEASTSTVSRIKFKVPVGLPCSTAE